MTAFLFLFLSVNGKDEPIKKEEMENILKVIIFKEGICACQQARKYNICGEFIHIIPIIHGRSSGSCVKIGRPIMENVGQVEFSQLCVEGRCQVQKGDGGEKEYNKIKLIQNNVKKGISHVRDQVQSKQNFLSENKVGVQIKSTRTSTI